jgi:hypothetical protein
MLNLDGYKMIFFLENLLRDYIMEYAKAENITPKILQHGESRALENGVHSPASLDVVLKFLDLGQLVDVIKSLSKIKRNYMNAVNVSFLIQQRNNIMHTRLITYDDFDKIKVKCLEVVRSLDNNNYLTTWNEFTTSGINDYEIPSVHIEYPVGKNFDKLIGRENDLRLLKEEIGLETPVSVIGLGGLGKTALVLQLIEDLIYSPERPFDRIFFMSFKNSVFENGEIKRFEKSIGNHKELINRLAILLGHTKRECDFYEIEKFVWDNIFTKRTLLVLDNLETEIVQSNLDEFSNIAHKFMRNAKTQSRLLVTSRYGIGERENPLALHQFELEDTKKLMYFYMKDQRKKLDKLDTIEWDWIQRYTQGNPGLIISLCFTLRSSLKPIKDIRIAHETEYSTEASELHMHHEEFLRFCFENTIESMPKESQTYLASLCYICSETNLYRINEELLSYLKDELKFPQKFGEKFIRAQLLVNIGFLQKVANSSQYTTNELIVDYMNGNYSDSDIINVFKLQETELFKDVKRIADLMNEITFDKEMTLAELLSALYFNKYRKTSDIKYVSKAFQCNPNIDILVNLYSRAVPIDIIRNFSLIDRLSDRELNDTKYLVKQQKIIQLVINSLIEMKQQIMRDKSYAVKPSDLNSYFYQLESKFLIMRKKLIDVSTRIVACKFLLSSKKLDDAEGYLIEDPRMLRLKTEIYVNQIGELAGSNRERCISYIDKLKHINWSKVNNPSLHRRYLIFCARFYRADDQETCITFINQFNALYKSTANKDDLSNYSFYIEGLISKAQCLFSLKKPLGEILTLLREVRNEMDSKKYKDLRYNNRDRFENDLERLERMIS